MRITVKYSGLLSEVLGVYSEEVEIPENTTIKDLIARLSLQHTQLRRVLEAVPLLQVHINGREVSFYSETAVLRDRDEVTLSLPLFEGG
ncbi:MAG: MoaD/ThiS family protein [Desulfurococcaceae archaeon]|jgi:molybdopterin converting factor small subunit